jgi:Na+/H+ antiporter NhaD/arsenite permease-like protein
MLIANDMALLTFLPLGFIVLKTTGFQKYMAFVFIMQNIAANLGGMLTPFGNPQNLYLYSRFDIANLEFIKIMAAPFVFSVILITACCFFIKPEPIKPVETELSVPKKKTAMRTSKTRSLTLRASSRRKNTSRISISCMKTDR